MQETKKIQQSAASMYVETSSSYENSVRLPRDEMVTHLTPPSEISINIGESTGYRSVALPDFQKTQQRLLKCIRKNCGIACQAVL